jgi:hypothetical protein
MIYVLRPVYKNAVVGNARTHNDHGPRHNITSPCYDNRSEVFLTYSSVVGTARALIYHLVHIIIYTYDSDSSYINILYILYYIVFIPLLLLLLLLLLILFCMHYYYYYYYFAVCFMIYIYLFFLLFCAFFVG